MRRPILISLLSATWDGGKIDGILGSKHFGWMESCLLNVAESILIIALFPFEPDLLKVAEISNASESRLLNGAELFLFTE